MGFEPTTPTLARLCSTPELRPLGDPVFVANVCSSASGGGLLPNIRPHCKPFFSSFFLGVFFGFSLATRLLGFHLDKSSRLNF